MRLIDADALSEKLCETTIFVKDGEVFQRMINDAPTESAETHDKRTETHGVCSGLISRADVLEGLKHSTAYLHDDIYTIVNRIPSAETTGALDDAIAKYVADGLMELPSADAVQGWIPVKYHEITEDERKENGYPKDWVYFLDCEMPSDDQEILVQARNGTIRWDVCYEDGGYSLDSGWDWKDDILAWMPLPEPYREDGDGGEMR